MRPILYSKNETRFDTYGLGEIDALKGNASRERNGNYSAYLEYPASGPLASVFEKEMKFKADAGTRTKNQTFEIVRIVKDSSSTIKIYAQHISHKLEYMSVRHGIKVSGTADLALKTWAKNLVGDYHFDTWSDIDTVLPITFLVDKMENARLALGGVEGSILDIWGGEYEFDNQTVRLHKRLGRRAPTVLEYGRNILSAESDESIESAYTSVVPFATYTPESQEGDSRQQDPVLVTIPESYVDSKYVSMYANRRIKVVDFSSEFKDEGAGESKKKDIPTPEKLKALAVKYMDNNRIGAPKINTKIEYVDLAQTLDYAERGWIEELELCDIVPVYYPQIGITEDDAKVTKVVYDFLNDRNESVEFGMVGESIRSAMTGGLAGRLDDLEKNQQSLENRQSEMAFELPKYLLDAKGNRVWNETPDENIEHKVGDIWFEKNGLYQRLYIWNGEMWEKRIDTEDVSKVGEKFDAEVKKINQSMATQTQQTAQALRTAGANASAIEAAKGAITKLNQDLTGTKQTNQAAIDRLKSDFASAQKTASDQTALLKSDLANIRTKQSQAESEIAKQVQALNQTKTELAGVKSAQANYEQTTTRRLAELANVADGKASKSELVQTAEELKSRIASVHLGRRNLLKQTQTLALSEEKPWITADSHDGFVIARSVAKDKYTDTVKLKTSEPPKGTEYVLVFYARASRDNYPIRTHFYSPNTTLSLETSTGYKRERSGDGEAKLIINREWKRYWVKYTQTATDEIKRVFIGRHGSIIDGGDSTTTVEICAPALFEGNIVSDWSPAPEDQEEHVSAVESTFKQKADSLEASVSSLREGLKTKADSSALTVLSDSIKQSVKSLETDMDNKLNSKLSTAEFEVRAGSIRQEILNATKDKADKALVTAEAGKLREELASLQVGGRNLLKGSKGPFNPNRNPANFDNNTLYLQETSVYLVQNEKYRISAKSDGNFTSWHSPNNENDNVVLWLMDKSVTNYQIVSNAKTGTTGTEFVWNRPTGIYHLRVNTYRKDPERLKSVWEVKVEQGSFKTDWSPAPEDTEGQITEAKATFERTAQGLRTDLSAIQSYVNADGTRAEALRTYSREETARQLTAERKAIEAGYVAKTTYTEDAKSINRRFEELTEGGVNLLRNSATLPTAGDYRNGKWVSTSGGNGTAQVVPVPSPPNPLIKSMIRVANNTVGNKYLSQSAMDLVVGQKYTVSCYARVASDSPSSTVGLLIRSWANNNDTNRKLHKIISNREWQRYSFTFTADVVANSMQFGQSGAGSVEICAPKIELGAVATNWSPSPEDATSYADTKLAEFKQGIDGQLASVQAAINTANGSLTNFNTWKQSAQETLNKVSRVESGINETRASFAEFKRTAEGQLTTITQQVSGKASQTDFQRVQETSKLYERLIGSTEKEITDKVSRMVMTNQLFQTEVSKNQGLKTVQSQLAGSWSIKNLNSASDILGQLNLNPDGSVAINEGLISIGDKTHIKNGVIKNAMIESMLADKITAGTLNAANVNIVNLNANKIVGLDANFIKSKIELAFIEWMKGKTISAQNDAMQINLNDGHVLFYNDDASIKRVLAGYPTQFIRYENKVENGRNHGRTIIGSNRNGTNAWKSVSFAGLVIDNNSNNSVDKIYQFGDYNHMRHAQGDDGWNFSVVTQTMTPGVWNKNSEIWARHFVVPRETKGDTDNPTKFIRLEESVAAIWDILNHAASGQVTMTQAMQNLINSRKANWNIIRNVG